MHRNTKIRGNRGFTLVELLVVMAIIAILASIVVPNVARYITRSRMTNALSEIKNIDTAFTGMLSDAQVGNFRDFFDPNQYPWPDIADMLSSERFAAATEFYTNAFYELARNGKNIANPAAYGLRPEVVRKLGTNYIEVDKDPWGKLYQIYAGPWRAPLRPGELDDDAGWSNARPPFRTRIVDSDIPGGPAPTPSHRVIEGIGIGYYGPRDLPIYVWSTGQNLISGQAMYQSNSAGDIYHPDLEPEQQNGGDDINNWDSGQTWDEFYG